jgi:hypothetical protein
MFHVKHLLHCCIDFLCVATVARRQYCDFLYDFILDFSHSPYLNSLYLLPEKRRLAAVTVAFPLQLTLQKFDDGFLHLLRRCVLRKVFFQLACVDFQGFFLVALFLRHNRKYRIHVKPPALA